MFDWHLMLMLELCTIIVVGGSVAMYYENRHLDEALEFNDLKLEHATLVENHEGLLMAVRELAPDLQDQLNLSQPLGGNDQPLFHIFGHDFARYDWTDESVNESLIIDGVSRAG